MVVSGALLVPVIRCLANAKSVKVLCFLRFVVIQGDLWNLKFGVSCGKVMGNTIPWSLNINHS